MQIAAHFNNHREPFVINVLTFIRPLRNGLCALGAAFALLGALDAPAFCVAGFAAAFWACFVAGFAAGFAIVF